MARLLKPLNTISRKHFYDNDDNKCLCKNGSSIIKYSYKWINDNVYKTEEQIRDSMNNVDGYDVYLDEQLFGEFHPILKSFDQMLVTQFIKYDRHSKDFIYDDGNKFHYFNSLMFLEKSGSPKRDFPWLHDICFTWVEEGWCTWDMEIENKHQALSTVSGLIFDFDGLYDEEWNLEEFDKPRLIKIIKDLEGLIKDTVDIVNVGLGRKE